MTICINKCKNFQECFNIITMSVITKQFLSDIMPTFILNYLGLLQKSEGRTA